MPAYDMIEEEFWKINSLEIALDEIDVENINLKDPYIFSVVENLIKMAAEFEDRIECGHGPRMLPKESKVL